VVRRYKKCMGKNSKFALFVLMLIFFSGSFAYGKCNYKSSEHINELSSPHSIKKISVDITKKKKWFRNGLKILHSNTPNIGSKYKQRFSAILTVDYKFGTCRFKAKVRQSGDWKDHIKSIGIPKLSRKQIFGVRPASNFISSLDVKLNEGNILNAVSFKLLIPETRNGINEVFGTLFLRRLGFIAQETFLIPGLINGVETKFLFQEKARKELLERNNFREGPIFSGDESLIWEGLPRKHWLADVSLTRLVNDKWVAREKNTTVIAVESFIKLQNEYVEYWNLRSSRPDKYDYFINPNQSGNNLFGNFSISLAALNGLNSFHPNNRKFYFDILNQKFHPIYYDGNTDVTGLLTKGTNGRDPELKLYLNNASSVFVKELIRSADALPTDELFFSNFWSRSDLTEKETKNFITAASKAIVSNVNAILRLNSGVSHYDYPKRKTIQSTEVDWSSFKVRMSNHNHNSQLVSLISNKDQKFYKDAKSTNKEPPFSIVSDEDLINLISKNQLFGKRAVLGEYRSESPKLNYLSLDFLNGKLLFSEGSTVTVDNLNRSILLEQKKSSDWFLIKDAVVDGWKIEFSGELSNAGIKSTQRFNEFGLTGCLTFYNVSLSAASIFASNGLCEDSVNFISSKGSIKYLSITNSYADGADFDFSSIGINKLDIYQAGNDCIDLSFGDYSIGEAILTGCRDKGISVGERSALLSKNVIVSGVNVGIASKDLSTTKILNFTGKKTVTCLEAFAKKQEFGGGYLAVDNYFCEGLISRDNESVIVVSKVVQ
jgi:hypothetical protein